MAASKNDISFRGFTLVELLIVVTVMGVLMAASIPTFNSYNKSQTLAQAVRNVRTDLRTVQNFSVSGAEGMTWGIHFEALSPTYHIFKCTPGTSGGYLYSNNIGCTLNHSQTLAAVTRINSDDIDVAFDSVTGAVYVNGSLSTSTSQVIIAFSDGSSPKSICISQTGGIKEC